MRLFLIRHAQAGERTAGRQDLHRQLDTSGLARAQELATMLADQEVARVVSSPASRCIQTVLPLAQDLGLEVEEHPDLWEGSSTAHVLALLEQHAATTAVACTHGDIIPDVIDALGRDGVQIKGRGCEKGSIWILDHDGDRWTSAGYVDRSTTELPN